MENFQLTQNGYPGASILLLQSHYWDINLICHGWRDRSILDFDLIVSSFNYHIMTDDVPQHWKMLVEIIFFSREGGIEFNTANVKKLDWGNIELDIDYTDNSCANKSIQWVFDLPTFTINKWEAWSILHQDFCLWVLRNSGTLPGQFISTEGALRLHTYDLW